MKNKKDLLFTCVLWLLLPFVASANEFIGFWDVEKVVIGEEEMTPRGKWLKILEDGTYYSGNGWLQHTSGTWTLDSSKMLFELKEDNGIIDPFGPFKLSFVFDKMQWEREEEGTTVVVTLHRIEQMPKLISDEIKGLWAIEKVFHNEEDITKTYASESEDYLMFRWDKMLVEGKASGEKNYAYWYVHPHRSELRIIGRNDDEIERWRIEIIDNNLLMSGLQPNNKGMKYIYKRLHQFPY